MRVGVSFLNYRPGKVGGCETYLQAVARELPKVNDRDEFIFIVPEDIKDILASGSVQVEAIGSIVRLNLARSLEAFLELRSKSIEKAVAGLGLDVILFPQQSIFPLHVSSPAVLTVGDVQHLQFPHYFALFDRMFRATAYPRSLEQCDRVIAISQFTKEMLIEKCSLSAEKISVVHHGAPQLDCDGVSEPEGMDYPYYFYPAASFPHKGHEVLIRSFADLVHTLDIPQHLIFTGMQTSYWRRLEQRIKDAQVADRVHHLGFVNYNRVLQLYRGADAVVFPTEYEGFGIPVLEAAQFNKCLVCSKLAVFTEIGVPEAAQIDFADRGELANALAAGPTTLTKIPISWQESMRQTLAILRETAGSCN